MRFSAMLRGLDGRELSSAAEDLLRLLDGVSAAPGNTAFSEPAALAAPRRAGLSAETAAGAVSVSGTDAEQRRALAEALETISAERTGAQSRAYGSEDAGTDAAIDYAGSEATEAASAAGARVLFTAVPETDMDAVSEFFRRDSRRYDVGFGG